MLRECKSCASQRHVGCCVSEATADANAPKQTNAALDTMRSLRPSGYLPTRLQLVGRAQWFCAALLFSACVAAPHSLGAEAAADSKTPDLTQLPIETLMEMEVPKVFSASKFEQKTTEAPAWVTILTSQDAKLFGWRTLGDMLESVPGMQISYDRNYQFLGVRGINLGDFNSRVLLLVDGHRVNNNLTDGAYLGTAFILDVDLIDRVEVIQGPSSSLYGNNAFFGVINVMTRKPEQLNGFEASAEYGAFDTYKGRLTFGKAFTNGINFLVSGTLYDSGGEKDLFFPAYNDPQHNSGIAHDLDADAYGSCFASIGYYGLTLEGAFIERKKDNPTAQYFATFNASGLRTVDDRGYASLKFDHDFPEILEVTARLYYDRNDFEIGYPVGDPVQTAFYKETQSGQWWGTELQLSKRVLDKHVITVGAEFRDDFVQEQRVYDPNTGETFLDNNGTRRSYGVYAEGEFALLRNLRASGGVRYDKYGDFDGTVNPRLALIYDPFTNSTIKAIYGTAFRAPNFLELSDPRFQDISPEKIHSYELVYEQGIGGHLRSSLSGFWNEMDHLIVFQDGNFTNIDAESRGVELALEGFWTNVLRFRASYTFQKAENQSQPVGLADSPEHLAKLNLSVPFWDERIFAGLELQYTSGRATFFTTTTGETVAGADLPGFTVLNFTIFSQRIVRNLELSASVYNLLDQHYGDPATRFHLQNELPRDGRSFRIKMTYRF